MKQRFQHRNFDFLYRQEGFYDHQRRSEFQQHRCQLWLTRWIGMDGSFGGSDDDDDDVDDDDDDDSKSEKSAASKDNETCHAVYR